MTADDDQISRQTGYLLRDIFNLPERERINLFEKLREDLAAATAPSISDQINAKMAAGIEALDRVAEHLGYDDEASKLGMKMVDEFNAAPEELRGGLKARQIAGAFSDSWPLAKQASIRTLRQGDSGSGQVAGSGCTSAASGRTDERRDQRVA